MNQEQFVDKAKEFEDKYGEYLVKFSSYYKYTFTFYGVTEDGVELIMNYGGNSDDIYRLTVDDCSTWVVNEYDWSSGRAIKDGVVIDEFDNW